MIGEVGSGQGEVATGMGEEQQRPGCQRGCCKDGCNQKRILNETDMGNEYTPRIGDAQVAGGGLCIKQSVAEVA